MVHPFLAASRRQGSNRAADYQSPRPEYRGPRGPAANENAPFVPSRIPQTRDQPVIPPMAREAADSLLSRFPAYRIGKIGFDLYQMYNGMEGREAHPNYSPEMMYQHSCGLGPSDPGNWIPYMREVAFGPGQCGGPEQWKRGSFPNQTEGGTLNNPLYFKEIGEDLPAAWFGAALTAELDYIGGSIWEQIHVVYRREVAGIATYKGENPAVAARPKIWGAPAPGTLPWPSMAPESMPIGEFLPTPHPPPREWLKWRPEWKPMRAPSEQSQRGPARLPRPQFPPVVGVTVGFGPKPGPQIRLGPAYNRQPPGRGRKERKIQVRGVGGILLAVNAVTEGFDFIDALYKALPKEFKKDGPYKGLRRSLRPHEKLQQLYRNYAEVDIKQAIKNVIENQVEDRFFGGIGQGLKRLNRSMGRPVGVQAGQGGPGKVPKGTQLGTKPWDGWTDYIWP